MKGSPAKMGTIKGTATHKSLLKQRRSVLRQEEQKEKSSEQDEKRNIIESFMDFIGTKQTESGREMGDLKRRMRHPNIEVRMKAERENRERLKKDIETESLSAESTETTSSENKPEGYYTYGTDAYKNRFRKGGDLSNEPKPTGWYTPGHDMYGGEPTSSSRPTGYYDKTSDNYMKGVEDYDLANMKFFSPERKAYYEAKGWALDETVDPNFKEEKKTKETKEIKETPTDKDSHLVDKVLKAYYKLRGI